MALETITATGLDSWACYFINGDSDSLDTEEQAAADQFAAWLGGSIVDCQDAGFLWRPDSFQFYPFGGNCQEYTALIDCPIFQELQIGQCFDWVNPLRPGLNSFFEPCRKISPRRYQSESGQIHKVGSIKARVYNVKTMKEESK